jgi:hypothetical protein
MSYSYSDTVPSASTDDYIPFDTLVYIYVWDAFTIKHMFSYAGVLAYHSVDMGPFTFDNLPPGRTCYRFRKREWNTYVKPYLMQNRIPVTIRVRRQHSLA